MSLPREQLSEANRAADTTAYWEAAILFSALPAWNQVICSSVYE